MPILDCEFIMPEGIMLAFKCLIILCGFVFLFLIWWIPYHIERLRNHGGGYFTPGFESLQKALTSLITAFSILSAIAAVFIGLPFYVMKSTLSIVLGVITFIIFSFGIVSSLYLLLIRPLSGTEPTTQQCYYPLKLLLLGLGFTMFTLASFL